MPREAPEATSGKDFTRIFRAQSSIHAANLEPQANQGRRRQGISMTADTFFYPSGGEDAFFDSIKKLAEKYPHDIRHCSS
jgi:hypothetical protein